MNTIFCTIYQYTLIPSTFPPPTLYLSFLTHSPPFLSSTQFFTSSPLPLLPPFLSSPSSHLSFPLPCLSSLSLLIFSILTHLPTSPPHPTILDKISHNKIKAFSSHHTSTITKHHSAHRPHQTPPFALFQPHPIPNKKIPTSRNLRLSRDFKF